MQSKTQDQGSVTVIAPAVIELAQRVVVDCVSQLLSGTINEEIANSNWNIELKEDNDNNGSPSFEDADYNNVCFQNDLKKWATSFNIRHVALKELSRVVNKRFPNALPLDARTLLKTPRMVTLIQVGVGQYWHHGFEVCIRKCFGTVNQSFTIHFHKYKFGWTPHIQEL